MDFRLTFEEGQARLFERVTFYPWQSQCRSRHQRRSRHLEKVTRCSHAWRLQDLSLRLISLVRFRRDSRLTLKKVKSDCFRRSLPIRTSENINAVDNISPFWALRMSGLNLENSHGAFKLDFWKASRFRHGLPTDFGEGQARLFEKVTSHLRQGQCRSGHRWRSVLRITADKSNIHLCEGQGVNLEKDTVLSCWTSGRPPDSVMDFRLTFEEGQARLFERVTSCPWQSQCRSRYQRRSKHLEKVTRCFHAWLLQNLSLRLISLARFRLIPSVSEGYIPRIPPRSSTRRTITKKKHHWVFQSRSRMKNPEAAAASQQLARYWRCLVLVQATALGNHSETVFLRQVCFLNWRGPGSWGRDLCPQQMNRWWQAKETEVKASVNPWEIEKIFIKFWREKGWVINSRGEWSSEKLSEIEADVEIRRLGAKKFRNCSTWVLSRTWNSKITASSGEYMGQCSKRKN